MALPHRIEDCCKELQDAWPHIKADFEERFPGWEIALDSTHRTPEEQFELYKIGRRLNTQTGEWEQDFYINKLDGKRKPKEVVTRRDGFKKLSMHNHFPSLAFDVKIRRREDHDWTWKYSLEQWDYMPVMAAKYGVVSGRSWKEFPDSPHFEIHNRPSGV